jgi:hypothetical protein
MYSLQNLHRQNRIFLKEFALGDIAVCKRQLKPLTLTYMQSQYTCPLFSVTLVITNKHHPTNLANVCGVVVAITPEIVSREDNGDNPKR